VAQRQRLSDTTRDSRHYAQELKHFGKWVRANRTLQQLTIEAAAEKLQMDPTHLAKIEAGTINLSFVTIVRITQGLKLPPLSELLVINTTRASTKG